MTIETSHNEGDTSALARRRRKARLSRKNENDKRLREEDDDEPEEVISGPRKKPHITGIKCQARYDPGVPMTRDELTSWRKEARRVRNRESAAASRQRTREKIDELEDKLASLSSKYAAALKRIAQLEAGVSNHPIVPTTVSQEDSSITQVSPISSPHLTSVSPASSPRSSFSLDDSHHQVQNRFNPLPAVKISGAVTSEPSEPDASVNICSDDSSEAIDETELSDFLMDALTDFQPMVHVDEHEAFLDSLCSV